ncbi:hypothetical protein C8Q75DRAFT_811817 [Abortiporus biennis]|nr:hypothetical protein C8Q75DRAFT_811817 [Abortiporus biennis]
MSQVSVLSESELQTFLAKIQDVRAYLNNTTMSNLELAQPPLMIDGHVYRYPQDVGPNEKNGDAGEYKTYPGAPRARVLGGVVYDSPAAGLKIVLMFSITEPARPNVLKVAFYRGQVPASFISEMYNSPNYGSSAITMYWDGLAWVTLKVEAAPPSPGATISAAYTLTSSDSPGNVGAAPSAAAV